MVYKKLYLVRLITVFIFLLILLNKEVKSCTLHVNEYYTEKESWVRCTGNVINGYKFGNSFSECVIGYKIGEYYTYKGTICGGPYEAWNNLPSFNGQICLRKCGWLCEREARGVYDESTKYCVVCDNHKRKIKILSIDQDGREKDIDLNPICESACGAPSLCDEVLSGTSPSTYPSVFCSFNCEPIVCYPIRECIKVEPTHYGQPYICIYSYNPTVGWRWILENQKPVKENQHSNLACFDNYDNDCDGLIDCKDPDCTGVINPINSYDICCNSDDQCTNIQCDGNLKPYCSVEKNKCECRRECRSNDECIKYYCCTDDPNGPKTGERKCVPSGTIINLNGRSYICDPPYFEILLEEDSREKNISIFRYILNFLRIFLNFN